MAQRQFSLLPVVTMVKGRPMALSTDVAAYFNKRHNHVLRDIDRIVARCTPEQASNFGQLFLTAKVGQGAQKPIRAYQMTKDGFTFLAMGFTGPEADAFKWNYIAAFNAMARQLAALRRKDQATAMGEAELDARVDALVKANGPRAALAAQARQLHAEGLTYAQISVLLHLSSRHVVYRLLKRFGSALSPTSRQGKIVDCTFSPDREVLS